MLLVRFRPTSSSIAVRTCTARPFEPQPTFYNIVTPGKEYLNSTAGIIFVKITDMCLVKKF